VTDLDVAVVGAGLAGLSTAYWLSRAGHRVEVFESEGVAGGRMRSSRIDGYTVDRGAETLAPRGYPATWRLIRELNLHRDGAVHRIRHPVALWRGGRAYPWLGHPLSVLTGAGMPPRRRIAMTRMMLPGLRHGMAPDNPADTPYGTRTLADLGAEYGEDMVRDLLGPISASAFGWLPERSAAAPLLSIVIRTRGVVRWRTYRDGQDTLTRALARRLPVHVATRVTEVKRDGTGARIELADGTSRKARAVVVTLPAPQVAGIYPDVPHGDSDFLRACTFSSVMRVAVLLDRPLEPRRRRFGPRLYAALLPAGENPLLCGCTVEHNKCPARAPAGGGLLSLLISPRRVPELFDEPDDVVVREVLREGATMIDGLQDAVVGTEVVRWKHALPEAPPEAVRRWSSFIERDPGPIEYAGDWLFLRPSSESAAASADYVVPRVESLLSR
jgi:protoporphyrinogen/coproporphyrinogen III oxidase